MVLASPIVELSIQERAGLGRVNEPILVGVPLPEGAAYTDSSRFTLRDQAGTVVPCEFRVASRWLKNRNAIRWLHLDFQTSVAANTINKVTLNSEASSYQAPSGITVTDLGNILQVNTDVLRFNVKKKGFNLLDEVWVDESGGKAYDDAHKIVASHARGLFCKIGGTQFFSCNDTAGQMVIERQGPMAVVIKATGEMKSTAGAASFFFITRIYAYANSGIVRIDNTIENRNGGETSLLMLADLRAELPLTLSANATALAGMPGGFRQTSLSSAEQLYVYTRRPLSTPLEGVDAVSGGKLTDTTFSPKKLASKDIGWAALYDGTKGCAVGMKDFWRLFPSSVETDGQGKIGAAIFSERAQQPLEIYSGVSRTQSSRFVFFNQKTPAELRALALGAENPLFATAPPSWYCRNTYSIGRLAERNQALYTPANWTTVSAMDSKLNTQWTQIFGAVESRNGTDSYGFLAWGDITHYVYCAIANPWCLGWDNNYYDIAHMGFQHFARTGDLKYLDFAVAHANHIEDVGMCHFGPGQGATGANRYDPPDNHVGWDSQEMISHVENQTSHHKTQSMFENYWLTGDPRALDVAVEGCDWAYGFSTSFCYGDNIATYQRRVSHQVHSLTWGYYQTKKTMYFNQAALIYNSLKTDIRTRVPMGVDWQHGFLMEAMADIYFTFRDQYPDPLSANYHLKDTLAQVLKEYGDWKYSEATDNSAYGYAFLSSFFGPTYLAQASTKLAMLNTSYSNTGKDFAENARSNELALFYYAIPDSVMNPVNIDKQRQPVRIGTAALVASPNPFNASITILLPEALPGDSPELAVYDLQGKKVSDLSRGLRPSLRRVSWKPALLPSGVYVIRYLYQGKESEQRITLMK